MVADDAPTFTLYRMRLHRRGRRRPRDRRVIGALEVVDEGAGGVLPHERTTPKASTDRLDLTRATQSNLSPVWGLSLTGGLTDLLADPAEPVGRCTDETASCTPSSESPTRSASRRSARRSRRTGADRRRTPPLRHQSHVPRRGPRATGRTDTAAELTMTYVGELVADQLSIEPIHRVYRRHHRRELLEAGSVSTCRPVAVTPAFAAEAIDRGALCLVRPTAPVWMTPSRKRSTASAPSTAPTSSMP